MRYFKLACVSLLLMSAGIASAQDYDYDRQPFKRERKSFVYPRMGSLNGDETTLALGMLAGGPLNRNFSVGLGFEYDDYSWGPLVPVFVHIRVNTSQLQVSPAFFFELGYGKSLNTRSGSAFDDGLYMSAGAGLDAFMSERTAFHIDLARRSQWHGTGRREILSATWAVLFGFSIDFSRKGGF